MSLTLSAIKEANKTGARTPVTVPEWGGYVLVRAMTVTEREQFEAHLSARKDDSSTGFRARLLKTCVVDEEGRQVFAGDDADAVINELDSIVTDRVINVIREVNEISNKSVDDAKKNSSPTPSEGSPSGSPAT